MTPLIDVTFLLLTYFMLASHFATAEKPDMALPQPDHSQAAERYQEDKIIINLLHRGEAEGPGLMFGAEPVATMDELSSRLQSLGRRSPEVEVSLRSDRHVRYGDVRRVMELIAAANLHRLQVVAELGVAE